MFGWSRSLKIGPGHTNAKVELSSSLTLDAEVGIAYLPNAMFVMDSPKFATVHLRLAPLISTGSREMSLAVIDSTMRESRIFKVRSGVVYQAGLCRVTDVTPD